MVLNLFILAAVVLESLRISIMCKEMRDLALEKGEPPRKWIFRTIALWVGIELTVFAVWYYFYGWSQLLIGAIILSIVVARSAFYFLKRDLYQRSDVDLEGRINEIGK